MSQQLNVSDMVLMTGGDDNDIVSGGFSVGSILLKKQLMTSKDKEYLTLKDHIIPLGLLYGVSKTLVDDDDDFSGLSSSQVIDDDLFTKLLSDWSVSSDIKQNKKKKTFRAQQHKKERKTKRHRNY